MTYRVLIADDEPLARRDVRARLRAYPAFAVEQECATGAEALAALTTLRPDRAFLDVQMPGMSGLDEGRFARALSRARRLLEATAPEAEAAQTKGPASGRHVEVERFWVKSCGRVVLVPVADVDWIAAEGDYVRLHVRDRSYLINDSLTRLETRLASAGFARIHRSTIVNLIRVAELRRHMSRDHTVRLTTGIDLRLSRTYYRRFVDVMREHCS